MSNEIEIKSGSVKSKPEPLKDIFTKNLKGFADDDIFVAYLYNEVVIDYYKNLDFRKITPLLLKIRLFNETQELLIWKEENEFKSRLRIDKEGSDTDYIDIEQVIFGTRIDQRNGKFILWEDRGTEVKLPFDVPGIDDKKNRLKVLVRNYVEYLNGCQASYYDNRFIKFIFPENSKKGG